MDSLLSKKEIWAIIPARSGSKGFVNKNITKFLEVPLLVHSINFAKKLKFVDKIILSTDSREYAEIGLKYGAEIPFLRGENASTDSAMEEDILYDLGKKCMENQITMPKSIVWLRPTHPLRSLEAFNIAFNKFKENHKSVCIVVEEDARIFFGENGTLIPVVKKFYHQSMVRRQDSPKAFRIFYGEIFKYDCNYNKKFLGQNPDYVVMPRECRFDFDNETDLQLAESLIEKNYLEYAKYIHTSY